MEKDAIEDTEWWGEPDDDAIANQFFSDLLKNTSPEVRRAMEKSYVESSSTILSTNWDEAGVKGYVKTRPPNRMVAKK
jgi:hypothetical protein